MRHELLNQFINFSINLNHHLATKYVLPNHSYIVQKQNSVGCMCTVQPPKLIKLDFLLQIAYQKSNGAVLKL